MKPYYCSTLNLVLLLLLAVDERQVVFVTSFSGPYHDSVGAVHLKARQRTYQKQCRTIPGSLTVLALTDNNDNEEPIQAQAQFQNGEKRYSTPNKKKLKRGFFLMIQSLLESAVRQITGESDYQLGDLGEKDGTNSAVPYSYQFGDITRTILAEVQKNNQQLSRKENNNTTTIPLEDENIRTNNVNLLEEWRNSWEEKDLPIDLLEQLYLRLDKNQRINLVLAACQLLAEGVVLWGLVTNVCTILTVSLSWTATLLPTTYYSEPPPLLPMLRMGDTEVWRTFVAKYMGFNLVMSPFFLLVKALGTLVGFRAFHTNIITRFRQSHWMTQPNRPWNRSYNSVVLQKAIALMLVFFMANVLLSALVAGFTVSSISLGFRIWLGWASSR